MVIVQVTSEQLNTMMQDAICHALALYSTPSKTETDRWFSVEELSEYLPGHPAITTIYGKVQRRELPHKRIGKRLVFLKSEIDQWMKERHCKTHAEIKTAAEQYVLSARKRG